MTSNPAKKTDEHGPVSPEVFMRRAIELARNGLGFVSPNPLVGSVVVHGNRIVGEGWHQRYGGPHAEVNAVESVPDKQILRGCTLYVSLEPCSHTGKTPPCADMLIRHGIPHVVIANQDPNPLVSGKGIAKLRNAGITVTTDILSDDAAKLNRRFFTYMRKGRPYIILKWAQTSDGFMARTNFDSKWISDAYSRQLVHKWRTEEDAVLVGSGTAMHDNPQLNVRHWTGRNPVRIVIDRNLRLDKSLNLFDGTQRTLCYNLIRNETHDKVSFIKLDRNQFLHAMMEHLFREKIQSVIVEGGSQLLKSFIEAGLWDEARIFISPATFREGIAAPMIAGQLTQQIRLMNDWLKIIEPVRGEEHRDERF